MERLEASYGRKRYVQYTTASGKLSSVPVGGGTGLVRKVRMPPNVWVARCGCE